MAKKKKKTKKRNPPEAVANTGHKPAIVSNIRESTIELLKRNPTGLAEMSIYLNIMDQYAIQEQGSVLVYLLFFLRSVDNRKVEEVREKDGFYFYVE